MGEIQYIPLSVTVGYFALVTIIGIYYTRKATSALDEYYVAGRTVGPIINAIAVVMAIGSAASFMGFLGMGYKLGFLLTLCISASAITGYVWTQFMYSGPLRRHGKFTLVDFLSERYPTPYIRPISALLISIFFFAYLIPQYKGGGVVADSLLGLDFTTGVILTAVIVLIYTSLGGMWAVTWNAVIQGIVALSVLLGLSVTAFYVLGGWNAALVAATQNKPLLMAINPKIPWLLYAGVYTAIFIFMGTAPHVVMRALTSKTARTARLTMAIVSVLAILLYFVSYVGIILGGAASFPKLKDPDFIVVELVKAFWHPIGAGLTVAAIMAAIMSTTDAMLLAIAAHIQHDLIELIKPDISERSKVVIAASVIIVASILAILLTLFAFRAQLIGVMVTLLTGAIGSSFFWPLVLGIWWPRATKWGGLFGVLSGSITYSTLEIMGVLPKFAAVFPALLISFLLTVLVSLMTSPPSKAELSLVLRMHKLSDEEYKQLKARYS